MLERSVFIYLKIWFFIKVSIFSFTSIQSLPLFHHLAQFFTSEKCFHTCKVNFWKLNTEKINFLHLNRFILNHNTASQSFINLQRRVFSLLISIAYFYSFLNIHSGNPPHLLVLFLYTVSVNDITSADLSKESTCNAEDSGSIPELEDLLEKL